MWVLAPQTHCTSAVSSQEGGSWRKEKNVSPQQNSLMASHPG